MPRIYTVDDKFDPDEEKKKGSCSHLREDLKYCLENSDCVKVQKRKVKDCYDSNELPLECLQLRTVLFECKRSLIDNRLRFRGKKDY